MSGWTIVRAPTGSTWAKGLDRGATPLPFTVFSDAVLIVSVEYFAKDNEVTAGMAKIKGDAKGEGGSYQDEGRGAFMGHAIRQQRVSLRDRGRSSRR